MERKRTRQLKNLVKNGKLIKVNSRFYLVQKCSKSRRDVTPLGAVVRKEDSRESHLTSRDRLDPRDGIERAAPRGTEPVRRVDADVDFLEARSTRAPYLASSSRARVLFPLSAPARSGARGFQRGSHASAASTFETPPRTRFIASIDDEHSRA
jgi:hypothetical protein